MRGLCLRKRVVSRVFPLPRACPNGARRQAHLSVDTLPAADPLRDPRRRPVARPRPPVPQPCAAALAAECCNRGWLLGVCAVKLARWAAAARAAAAACVGATRLGARGRERPAALPGDRAGAATATADADAAVAGSAAAARRERAAATRGGAGEPAPRGGGAPRARLRGARGAAKGRRGAGGAAPEAAGAPDRPAHHRADRLADHRACLWAACTVWAVSPPSSSLAAPPTRAPPTRARPHTALPPSTSARR